eukprot:4162287-Pyramimonas_sp.AAC.1
MPQLFSRWLERPQCGLELGPMRIRRSSGDCGVRRRTVPTVPTSLQSFIGENDAPAGMGGCDGLDGAMPRSGPLANDARLLATIAPVALDNPR